MSTKYKLDADQEFFKPCEYLVCTKGNYNAEDLVQVYKKGDKTKFALVAFSAKFIATGEN